MEDAGTRTSSEHVPPARRIAGRATSDPGRLMLLSGIGALLPLVLVVARHNVPSHWTSIWSDREFSGWVAPIANRLTRGHPLYGHGNHLPIGPLGFVTIRWVSGGHATWLTESAANFACQCLAITTLFAGFRRLLPWPAPLVAAFGVAVSFFSLGKVMVYDSLAQLGAALSATLAVHALLAPHEERARRWLLPLSGAASALTFLTKQSTGAGITLGVLLSIWGARRIGDSSTRAGLTVRFSAGLGAAFALGVAILSPWMSVQGFFRDALLTSSEAKGGALAFLPRIALFAKYLWMDVAVMGVPPLALAAGLLVYKALERQRLADAATSVSFPIVPAALGAAIGGAACPFLAVKTGAAYYPENALQTLLFLSIGALVVVRFSSEKPSTEMSALSLFTPMAFASAIGHSLSVDQFRWSYDNNPLIWVPLAFAATVAGRAFGALVGSRAVLAAACLTFGVELFSIGRFAPLWVLARECTETWPEVPFLRGAKLRPMARGMRRLVSRVRELTPNPGDEVFLLPNDPNVEAWFDRSRPRLTSSIVFGDQYLDRYVDEDFRWLRTHPPRVIVVGPRNFWRGFMHALQPDRGAERLGMLVVGGLIPNRYRLAEEIHIEIAQGDYMDVYVRNEAPPP